MNKQKSSHGIYLPENMINYLRRFESKIVITLLFFIAIVFGFMSVVIHNNFLTFGWDLGYFDQLIWKVSRGIYPFSDLSKVNILAGHFSPILFLFAPLYWIWSDPRILLISQSFLMVFAGLPLYLLAKDKLGSSLAAFSILFSYLFFIGTQWSILNEFHEATIIPFLLALIYLALQRKHSKLFWLSTAGLMFTKEEMLLLSSAIGLMIFFHFKKRKEGSVLFIFSFIIFFFLTNIFMPFISETGVYQHSHLSSTAPTPKEFVIKIVTDPIFTIKSLVTPAQKIQTFFISLFSFSLLPLFAPISILLPLIEQFLMRFLYTGPQFTVWLNVNHHAAATAMLLPIASIYGMKRLISIVNNKKLIVILSIAIIFSTITQDILLKAPIHSLLKKQFYQELPWMKNNNAILGQAKSIPVNIPISAQNSMYPHLSQREKIYLLPEIKDAKYIIVDLHDGPNKYSPIDYNKMVSLIDNLVKDGKFSIQKQQGKAILLKRRDL